MDPGQESQRESFIQDDIQISEGATIEFIGKLFKDITDGIRGIRILKENRQKNPMNLSKNIQYNFTPAFTSF